MKKIFTLTITVLLTTLCAVAQLPYNTNYSKDYFNQYSSAKQWYTLYEEEWHLLYYHKGMLFD